MNAKNANSRDKKCVTRFHLHGWRVKLVVEVPLSKKCFVACIRGHLRFSRFLFYKNEKYLIYQLVNVL